MSKDGLIRLIGVWNTLSPEVDDVVDKGKIQPFTGGAIGFEIALTDVEQCQGGPVAPFFYMDKDTRQLDEGFVKIVQTGPSAFKP